MVEEKNKWIDPDPESIGVLLSDRIEFYSKEINLIEDYEFDEERSPKPASYGLRLGSQYYKNGQYGDLKEGEVLKIPSNSIVFVSMFEKINMPYYMIGRFNLKIDLIYKGIILGTGPQVDPGFTGHLSCPLHNISSNDVEIKFKERFATIDFIKTTKFACNEDRSRLAALTNENELYKSPVKGFRNYICRLFPVDKKMRKKLDNYIPGGKKVLSSVKHIENSVADFKTKINREIIFRRVIGIGLVIGIFVIIIGLGNWVWRAFNADYTYIKDLKSTINQLEERKSSIEDIDQRINRINKKLEDQQKILKNISLQIEQIEEGQNSSK